MDGFLSKKGGSGLGSSTFKLGRKNWLERYFLLEKTTLSYFEPSFDGAGRPVCRAGSLQPRNCSGAGGAGGAPHARFWPPRPGGQTMLSLWCPLTEDPVDGRVVMRDPSPQVG